MKRLISTLLFIFWSYAGSAQIIEVNIKGMDDGLRSTKQIDYNEAVLFAKREAIERAGVRIKAMTTVKDFMLNSDYIESRAEAVLLPGYNIIDIGYQIDGTYLVVLAGKVKSNVQSDPQFGTMVSQEEQSHNPSVDFKIRFLVNRVISDSPSYYKISLDDRVVFSSTLTDIDQIISEDRISPGPHKIQVFCDFSNIIEEKIIDVQNNMTLNIHVKKSLWTGRETLEVY